MNRRSRMKSTLDSLFSSTKSNAPEPEQPSSQPPVEDTESKPAAPVLEKKPPAKKTAKAEPKAKPAPQAGADKTEKNRRPAPARKAVPAEIPVEEVKPEPPPPEDTAPPVQEETRVVDAPPPAPAEPQEPPEAPLPTEEAPQPQANPENEAVRASSGEEDLESDEEEQLVVFLLGGEAFGISIQIVESIIKKQAITKVPHVEKYILGVTNLRGTVVPVVDLRQRFSMPPQEATKDTRIIVLNTESGKNGIMVDEVTEVMRMPKSAIAPPPMIATSISTAYISGVAHADEKLIILLDMNSILQR